jgi:hypothetical protein
MKESNRRQAPRYAAAAAVLAVHLVLIAALMMAPRTGKFAATANAVEIVFVAPADPPRARVAANLPRRGHQLALTVEPPVLASLSLAASSAPTSSANGESTGVDWTAEARRALQAFEIRNHQRSASQSVSGRPEDDHWPQRAQHHAGERFKTENGDWMVWIDANCYEIARAASAAAHVAPPTEPICEDHPIGAAATHQ